MYTLYDLANFLIVNVFIHLLNSSNPLFITELAFQIALELRKRDSYNFIFGRKLAFLIVESAAPGQPYYEYCGTYACGSLSVERNTVESGVHLRIVNDHYYIDEHPACWFKVSGKVLAIVAIV